MPFTQAMIAAKTYHDLRQAVDQALIDGQKDLSGFTRIDGDNGEDLAIQVYPDGTIDARDYACCDLA